ncbi:MAG TPA: cobalamin-binding protein [Syntrophomonadaceae bacterium]|nr:cobalamin-binding protein [Syntrophomonadaceae bacterium]
MSYTELCAEVVNGNESKVIELTKSLLEAGYDPLEIMNKGLIAGMDIVGPRFKNGEMFVPEVLLSARALHSGINIVKEALVGTDIPCIGKIVLGTVKSDLHDIGKNLVGMMMESAGFKVIDLGVDVPEETFIEAVKEHKPDILALSALLTTTMPNMKSVIDALKENGLRDKVKVIIGGAPVSQNFADEIGADGYAPEAASAAALCKQLIAE